MGATWTELCPARAGARLAALIALAVLSAGCTEPNPLYCSRDDECASGVCVNTLFECAACDCGEDAPVCDAAEGICRGCEADAECPSGAPFCHPNGSCRACVDHEQCDSEVCDRDQGTCVAGDEVVYADAIRGSDGPGCGTEDEPCLTIAGAEGALDKTSVDRLWVRLRAATYLESVAFLGIEANLVGEDGVIVTPQGEQPGIYVEGDASVLLDRLRIEGVGGTDRPGVACAGAPGQPEIVLSRLKISSTSSGVEAADCAVTIEDSEIFENGDVGVRAESGTSLAVSRSQIFENGAEGIVLKSASFEIVNTVVADHPTGVRIEEFSPEVDRTRVLEHSTIAGSGSLGIQCAIGSAAHTFRNNILFGPEEPILGSCNHATSLIEGSPPESGNLSANPLFVDPEAGDFHIRADSPCVDAGNPASGVEDDLDRERRPQGSAPDIGADEVPPGSAAGAR